MAPITRSREQPLNVELLLTLPSNAYRSCTKSELKPILTLASYSVDECIYCLAVYLYDKTVRRWTWKKENLPETEITPLHPFFEETVLSAMRYVVLPSLDLTNHFAPLILCLGFKSGRLSIYLDEQILYTGFPYVEEFCQRASISDFQLENHFFQSKHGKAILLMFYTLQESPIPEFQRNSNPQENSQGTFMGISLDLILSCIRHSQLYSLRNMPLIFFRYHPRDTACDAQGLAVLCDIKPDTFSCFSSLSWEDNISRQHFNFFKEEQTHTEAFYTKPLTWDAHSSSVTHNQDLVYSGQQYDRLLSNNDIMSYSCFATKTQALPYSDTGRIVITGKEQFLCQYEYRWNFFSENFSEQRSWMPSMSLIEQFNKKNKRKTTLKALSKIVSLGWQTTSNVFSTVTPLAAQYLGFTKTTNPNSIRHNVQTSEVASNSDSADKILHQGSVHDQKNDRERTGSPCGRSLVMFQKTSVPLMLKDVRLDENRQGRHMCRCPFHAELALIPDQLGRILLIHLPSMLLLYMWKGYRDASVSWAGSASKPYILIYAPWRGLLELWALSSLHRIGVFSVGNSGVLESAQPFQPGLQHQLFVIFLSEHGVVYRLALDKC